MERKIALSEEEMLINKGIDMEKQQHSPSDKKIYSKWYDSWYYLNLGFLFLSTVFLFVSFNEIALKTQDKSLFKLVFSSETDKVTIKLKGTFWRTFYFYFFLLFSGFLGYLNRFSFAKYLRINTPYNQFASWRDLLMKCALYLLNFMWIINSMRYDLSLLSLFKQPIKWLFKFTCIWLDLLWSLSLLFCTRNTVYQYINQSPFSASIDLHKKIGNLTLIITLIHICLACLLVYQKQATSFISCIQTLWNFAPLHWTSFDFGTATTLLLRLALLLLLLLLTTKQSFRHSHWEFFHAIHMLLIPLFLLLFIYHSKRLHLIIRLPILLYCSDKLMRWFSRMTRRSHIYHISSHNGLITLDISVRHRFFYRRPFGRLIGAVVYLNIPEISWLEYHPLSVAYSYENHLVFFIRVVGDSHSWTHKLNQLVEHNACSTVYFEGPYCMEHHREIVEQGIPPVLSTFNLMKTVEPKNEGIDYYNRIMKVYGTNVLFVSGGVGLAGISSYILDLLHALERIPEEKRHHFTVTIVVAVAEPEHLIGMYNVLMRCQQSPVFSTQIYCTYRSTPEVKKTLSDKHNGCLIRPEIVSLASFDRLSRVIEIEGDSVKDLKYSVGRPDLKSIIQSLPYQECCVFFCGPKSMEEDCLKYLQDDHRIYSLHSEVFDM